MNLKTCVINKFISNSIRIMVLSKENKLCHLSGGFLVLMVILFRGEGRQSVCISSQERHFKSMFWFLTLVIVSQS